MDKSNPHKISYKHLGKPEKRLIKYREGLDRMERESATLWRMIHGRAAPPYLPDDTDETLQNWLDLVLYLDDRCAAVRGKKERLVAKYGLDEDEVARLHMMSNVAPGPFG